MACKNENGLGFTFLTPGLGPEGSDITPKMATSLKAVTDKYPELWEGNLQAVTCLGCGGLRYNKQFAKGKFFEDHPADLDRPQWVKDPEGFPTPKKTMH